MPFLFIIFLMVFPFPLIIIGPIFIGSTISGQKSRHKSITKRCYDFFRETKDEVVLDDKPNSNQPTKEAFIDDGLIPAQKPIIVKKDKYVRPPSDLL